MEKQIPAKILAEETSEKTKHEDMLMNANIGPVWKPAKMSGEVN